MTQPFHTPGRSAIRLHPERFQTLKANRLRVAIGCILPVVLLGTLALGQVRPVSPNNFKALSAKADAARVNGNLEQATLLYRRALALHSDWREGWWSLGMVQYVRSDYAGAARAFQKVIALMPDAETGTAHGMLGLCEFELDQDHRALRDIEQGLLLGISNDTELLDVLRYHDGILQQRMARFEGARRVFNGLCADGLQTQELRNGIGMVALRMNARNPPPEGSVAGQVVDRVGYASCLQAQEKFDAARSAYASVAQRYPDFPNVHYAYGTFLVSIHHEAEAIQEFKQEIKNDPKDVMSRLQIASADYRIDSAAGIPYAEEAVKINPNYPFGHYVLGLLLVDAKQYPPAVTELEIARRDFPNVPRVYFSLAIAYAHVGRTQDAVRARAKFAQLKQEQSTVHQDTEDAIDSKSMQ